MKVFITGATGLVGQALTQRLLADGAEVKALVRSPQKLINLGIQHSNLKIIPGDLNDKEILKAEMQGCEQLYHLAAIAGVWAPGNAFYEVNVLGTRHVMDAALAAGIHRAVVTATAGIIGPALDGPIQEDTVRKLPFFNEYEQTKAEALALAFSYQEKGMEVVATAPTRVFGPGPLNISNIASRIMRQYMERSFYFRPGDGTNIGNYVYLPDLVEGHIQAMARGRSGELYLMGGEDLDWNTYFDILGEIKGKKVTLLPLPMGVLGVFAQFQQHVVNGILGRPPMITPAWVKRYDYHWKVSSDKAARELDYRITPFREAAATTVAWMRNTGILERERLQEDKKRMIAL